MGSYGFFGRELFNKIKNEKHYYCFNCYSKAVDMYVADLKLLEAEKVFEK